MPRGHRVGTSLGSGVRCVAANCGNTSVNGVSLHKFTKDPSIRRIWTKFVDLKRVWIGPTPCSALCAQNFTEDCFPFAYRFKKEHLDPASGPKGRLNKYAVSTIHSTLLDQHPSPNENIVNSQPRKKKRARVFQKRELASMEHDRYKVFHIGKLLEMFNTAINEHSQNFPRCHGQLTFDRQVEERWGLVWRESMVCRTCSYKSNMHKLYTEVAAAAGRPGRKKATVNLGMTMALTQTPIGSESLTRLLAGGNIEGPSKRSISRISKSAGQIIIAANNADMSKRLQQLRKVNRWQGRPENVIPVQVDGVYNNNLYSGVGRTPFQPATQCTVTVAENLTPKKQIVAVETINKLCSKHGFHTKDDGTECDNKSAPCSATATIETNIGDEQQWAENCFRQLKHEGIETKFVTTDGDGKSFADARKLYESGVTNTEPNPPT